MGLIAIDLCAEESKAFSPQNEGSIMATLRKQFTE